MEIAWPTGPKRWRLSARPYTELPQCGATEQIVRMAHCCHNRIARSCNDVTREEASFRLEELMCDAGDRVSLKELYIWAQNTIRVHNSLHVKVRPDILHAICSFATGCEVCTGYLAARTLGGWEYRTDGRGRSI